MCLAGTWSTVAQLPTVRQHLSAVVGADGLIYTFGGIIEEGSHESLMEQGGHYAELYDTYFRHQSLEYVEKAKEVLASGSD